MHLNKTPKSTWWETDIHVWKHILLIFLVQWCQCYTFPLSDWGICCALHDFFLHHLRSSVVFSSDPPKQFDSLYNPNTKSHQHMIQACNESKKIHEFVRIWKFGGFDNDILLLSLGMLSDRSFSFHFFFAQSLQGHVCFFLSQLLFLLNQVILCQQKFSSLHFNFCKFIPSN